MNSPAPTQNLTERIRLYKRAIAFLDACGEFTPEKQKQCDRILGDSSYVFDQLDWESALKVQEIEREIQDIVRRAPDYKPPALPSVIRPDAIRARLRERLVGHLRSLQKRRFASFFNLPLLWLRTFIRREHSHANSMAEARNSAAPQFATIAAESSALPKNRSEVLLDALKKELFEVELDRQQGKISDADYAKAKAALDETLKRATPHSTSIE